MSRYEIWVVDWAGGRDDLNHAERIFDDTPIGSGLESVLLIDTVDEEILKIKGNENIFGRKAKE